MLTLRRSRPHGRLHDDSGLGLVEVLIGMVITGIVFSALAQTLIGSTRSVGGSQRRLHATQIASETIENIQSLEWSDIGFYDDQNPPAAPTVDGRQNWTVVDLGAVTPATAPANLPVPTATVTREGVAYTVDTAVVWDDVPPTTTAEMVRKRLRVAVSWTAAGRTRTVRASSLVSLPGSSAQPALFFMLLTSAGAPFQLIDDNGTPVTALGVTVPVAFAVETNRRASTVSIAWTDRAGVNRSRAAVSSVNGQTWAATEPSSTFVNGRTSFTFTATASGYPTDTQTSDVTFLHRNVRVVAGPSVTSGLTADGRICVRSNNGSTWAPMVVRVEVQGFQASDGAVLQNGPNTFTGVTASTTTRGVIQDITIPANTVIAYTPVVNTAAFTLTVARTSALPSSAAVTMPSWNVKPTANSGSC